MQFLLNEVPLDGKIDFVDNYCVQFSCIILVYGHPEKRLGQAELMTK